MEILLLFPKMLHTSVNIIFNDLTIDQSPKMTLKYWVILKSVLKREVISTVFSFVLHHNFFLTLALVFLLSFFHVNVHIAKEIKVHHCSLTEVRATKEFLQHCFCAIRCHFFWCCFVPSWPLTQEFSAPIFNAHLPSRVQNKPSSLSSVTKVQ